MMRLRPISVRERALAVVTAAIVLSGGLYVYAVEPFVHRWGDLRAQANELTAEHAKLLGLIERQEEIEQRYDQIRGALTESESKQHLQVALLKEVEDLARVNGLVVRSLKPLNSIDEGAFIRLSVQLSALSEGHQFVRMLHAMQRQDRLLCAEDLTVAAGRGRPPLALTLTISKLVRVGRTGTRGPNRTGSENSESARDR